MQTFGMTGNNPQETLGIFAIIESAIAQRLNKAFDTRNRRFQFMRYVRYKVASDVFEMSELRHIIEDDQHPDILALGIPQRRRRGLQKTFFRAAQHDVS